MNKRIAIITSACLIIPVLITAVWYTISFIGELNYVDLEKTVDYYTVITNNKNPVDPNHYKFIDEKLDEELARHRYASMNYKDAVTVLKQIENTDADVYSLLTGNGERVYMHGRRFLFGSVILTEENTYLFMRYFTEAYDCEYTLYVMKDAHLDRDSFSYLEKQENDTYSDWLLEAADFARGIFYQHRGIFIILSFIFVLGLISAVQEMQRKIYEKKYHDTGCDDYKHTDTNSQ